MRLIRSTAIVPVVLMGGGGVVSFGVAVFILGRAITLAVTSNQSLAILIVQLIRMVDASLVGILMVVLAFGIYELLIARVELPLQSALVAHDMWELERRVIETVVVIVAVTALEAIIEPAPRIEQLEIVAASAVVIVALGVFLRLDSGSHTRRP
jgi:uncharacterized membrane protein YqhA